MALTKVGGDLLKQPLTIGTGVTISSDGINASGIITATSFVGDISQATGASAGLGTALSQDQSSPLNKIYYTDTVLSVGSTITINPPDSSNIAYTQYAEISVDEGYDIIVEDGDDLIPDILGLSTTTAGPLSGAGGRVRADNFTNKAGTGAPTFPNGVNVTGVVTATSFSGNVTGDLTGNVTGDLTGNVVAGIITSSGISTFSDTVNVGAGKSIRLYGSSSGYSEIVAAAGSASTTFTLPANGGSASQYLQTNGAGVLSWATVTDNGLVWGDDEVSLSGTGQLWTGIPADVKQVIVAYQAWSNGSTSSWICEIGDSGGLETSGYTNVQSYSGSSSGGSTNAGNTSWGMSAFTDPVYISHGIIRITLIEASSNLWECQWLNAVQGTSNGHFWHVGGHKALSGTLDRVQIRPGTGSFDSGKANLLYLT